MMNYISGNDTEYLMQSVDKIIRKSQNRGINKLNLKELDSLNQQSTQRNNLSKRSCTYKLRTSRADLLSTYQTTNRTSEPIRETFQKKQTNSFVNI